MPYPYLDVKGAKAARALRKKGFPYKYIADRLGVSQRSVRRWCLMSWGKLSTAQKRRDLHEKGKHDLL